MNYKISVRQMNDKGVAYMFAVDVDGRSYKVSLPEDYYQKLTGGKITPEELVKKSFEFLLEREGPESILPEFELSVIQRYFPEYEDEITT